MGDVVSLINSVGFPIAVSIALFYQNNKNGEDYREIIISMQKTIENNTIAIRELSFKLDDNINEKGVK